MVGNLHKRTSKKALRRTNTPAPHVSPTITWDEIPDWQKDNEYIISGYRRLQHQWKGCITSVYQYLHNETVNIHTHLWGAALFAYFLITFHIDQSQYPSATWADSAVFVIFFLCAIFCLSGSAFYHMATCHSQMVARSCHALDYSGIVTLIVGSMYPSIYYGFFCEVHLRILYLTAITLAGVGAATIVLNPEYAKPTHREARTTVFICLGGSAFIPITHGLITHGFERLVSEMGFQWLLFSGMLYLTGAVLYAKRIPERLHPGKYDLLFASHQIFHVFVVLAALAHYVGILNALAHRHTQAQQCAS